jgi:hypothetical protein
MRNQCERRSKRTQQILGSFRTTRAHYIIVRRPVQMRAGVPHRVLVVLAFPRHLSHRQPVIRQHNLRHQQLVVDCRQMSSTAYRCYGLGRMVSRRQATHRREVDRVVCRLHR